MPYTIGTARTARKNEFGENCFSFFSLAAYFVQIIRYVCSLMRSPAAAPAGSQIFRTLYNEWNEGKKKIDHHHICRIRQYYIRFFLRGAGGFCVGFNILIYIKSYTPSTFPIHNVHIWEANILKSYLRRMRNRFLSKHITNMCRTLTHTPKSQLWTIPTCVCDPVSITLYLRILAIDRATIFSYTKLLFGRLALINMLCYFG